MSETGKKVVPIGIPDVDAEVHQAFKIRCIRLGWTLKDRIKWLIECDSKGLFDNTNTDHIGRQDH